MSEKHTQGRLKIFTAYAMPEIRTQDDVFVANTPPRTEANARRLVACWNLLDGVPTEKIEESLDYGSSWGKVGKELAAMTVQRDELLAALKSLMEMLDDEIKTSTDEQLAFGLSDSACPDHIKRELKCVIACRAAIAKAGGEV